MSQQNNKPLDGNPTPAEKLLEALFKLSVLVFSICKEGLWRLKSCPNMALITIILVCTCIIADNYLNWMPLDELPPYVQALLIAAACISGMVFCLGFGPWIDKMRIQKAMEALGLKNSLGQIPKVISICNLEGHRRRIVLDSFSVGLDRYKLKKRDLEAALDGTIESIASPKSPRFVELTLSLQRLPRLFQFSAAKGHAAKELSFIAGRSQSGIVTVDLQKLPHLLITGTTGGGKSIFFKQMLVSILKNTPRLQLYLIDLKRGVEMRPFESVQNVRVAKTEQEAVLLLNDLKMEMDKRFTFLEKTGKKEICPDRDKLDRIVVGVDEASVIYTRTRSNDSNKDLIEQARELTDELAKLSRAAGMHLILATQKVTKETIDTKVQENIGGRLCFRMNTLQGSMTVLGNKLAHILPDIKGRGIWAQGSQFIEVQAPFLSEDALEEELSVFRPKPFGPMLEIASPKKSEENTKMSKGDY